MTSHGNQYSVTLPIQSKSLAFAKRISRCHERLDIQERVFKNAIAVVTSQSFFEILGIESHYETSDLANPVIQCTADLSDLDIVSLGKLECRWIAADIDVFTVPYEGWGDRIGYVFVSFNLQRLEATIQGFLPTIKTEQISCSELRSVEFMLQYLDAMSQQNVPTPCNRLTQWLAGAFEPNWKTVESLLHPTVPSTLAFRGTAISPSAEIISEADLTYGGMARRAKILSWQSQVEHLSEPEPQPVVLVVEINQGSPLLARVIIQMHPVSPSTCLPPNIALSIVDQDGQTIIQATSRVIDNYLQLPFKAEPGELFQVKLELGPYQITENFQL